MKILFDGCDFVSRTGPNTFARRLAMQLANTGHIIADPDDYDVVLAFIQTSFPIEQYRAPVVQRLDGIWFSPSEFLTKNVDILTCYRNCDHTIFQSNFDRKMILKLWGEPNVSCSIVGNGIKIDPLKDASKLSYDLLKLRNEHEKVFVCSANWHGQKRLKQNVELFRHLKTNFYPRSCLIVLGSNPQMFPGTDIFYTGNVSHELCAQTYSIADWMLHLSWLDHAPNAVIECMMQGTPVVCSEDGGTCELVRDFGVILKETSRYNFDLVDYDDPPDVDVRQVDRPLPDIVSLGKHADIDIATIGRQYVEVLEEVVGRSRK